jgi:hypothetical protein
MNDHDPEVSPEVQRRFELLQERYRAADALVKKGRYEEAISAFESGLDTLKPAFLVDIGVAVVHHDIVQRLRNKASRHRAES